MSFVTTPGQHEKTSPGNVNKYSPDQERDDEHEAEIIAARASKLPDRKGDEKGK